MNWKTGAGLALALAGWSRFSQSAAEAEKDEPTVYVIISKDGNDPCPPGQYRGAYDIIKQGFVCIPIKK